MSNFDFLKSDFPEIYSEVREAESFVFNKPRVCAIFCRSTLEKTLRWMFANDASLELPNNDTVSNMLHNDDFRRIVGHRMFQELNLVRKIGNNSAHGENVKAEEAFVCIKNQFRFLTFIALSYSDVRPNVKAFDETNIPKGNEESIRKEEFENTLKQLEEENTKLKILQEKQNQKAAIEQRLQKQLEEARAQNEKLRKERATIASPEKIPVLVSEAQTRKHLIDQMLLEAGWKNLKEGYHLEYEVQGMPKSTNPTGKGCVDYVLWGDNGKPLAVVEAKSTIKNAHSGKQQAKLYADCLEKMHDQRPVTFYSNGYETYLWDDTFYPEREVFGFYTKDELQLIVDRRNTRKDIRAFKVNEDIAGRKYQLEAIKRVAETYAIKDYKGNLVGKGRKALLVMATGSGKTRTSAAIIDMLTRCNWAKRVLFLADRNALLIQAKKSLNTHLPHLSAIDLTKEKEETGTRIVFSTYKTMLNRIDSAKVEDKRHYGVGYFDLVIIDEAHRSIYSKYRSIFEYFDCLLLGLTATPKKDIDHDTFMLFDIEDDNPTFAYNLDEAVKDGFLVPPKAIEVPIKFLERGIKYSELSDKEKKEYEEKFGDPTAGEAPDIIGNDAINKWLFNTNTVDLVLSFLMEKGIHVQGGDKIGKTIIFAKNHEHALFIEKRFNKNYPEHRGNFLRVIDNYESKAQDLIDKFCNELKDEEPQIAVSVDMMDTGIDAPSVVNLVYFKPVYSSSKFWQMLGRGTRLRPDLFGPKRDKEHFLLIDFCKNLEFFEFNPDGIKTTGDISLLHKVCNLKLELALEIRKNPTVTEDDLKLGESLINELFAMVTSLNLNDFRVRMKRRTVDPFFEKDKWLNLSFDDKIDLKNVVFGLISPEKGDHELARRFDVLMLTLKLHSLQGLDVTSHIKNVIDISKALLKQRTVPAIAAQEHVLIKIGESNFWKNATLTDLNDIREALRDLIKLLEKKKQEIVYTTFKDDFIGEIKEKKPLNWIKEMVPYKEKVESFIKENETHIAISKLKGNEPITEAELQELERILFENKDIGTREDFVKEYGAQPLGQFVRSILGLDRKAAMGAFSDFINSGNLSANQQKFINQIIDFLEVNGVLESGMLFESPFDQISDNGVMGVFDDDKIVKIISIVKEINKRANVG